MLDLKKIYYFVSVAETLSFSRAAENIYISQSALSQRIQDLEHDLGVQLFVRHNRSLSLTAAGQDLLERSRPLLLNADNIELYFKEGLFNTNSSSSITLGLEVGFIDMPGLLDKITSVSADLSSGTAKIKILYEFVSYTDCYKALKDRLVDVMISDRIDLNGLDSKLFTAVPLQRIPYCLVARKEDGAPSLMTWEDVEEMVANAPLLLLQRPIDPPAKYMDMLHRYGLSPQPHYLPSPPMSLVHMMSGHGYTVLPLDHFTIGAPHIKYYPLEDQIQVNAIYRISDRETAIRSYVEELCSRSQSDLSK